MQSVKKEISDLLEKLPDDCTIEDIQYHLYVIQKIEKGLSDIENGNTKSQEEVEKIMSKWIEK